MNISKTLYRTFAVITLAMSWPTSLIAAPAVNPLLAELDAVARTNPGSASLQYYLGVLNLREGNRDAAIAHWNAFLALAQRDPANSKYVAVREQLTGLKQQAARDAARESLQPGPAPEAVSSTIAVLEPNTGGSREAVAFAKGMTAMVITDLSKVPQLKVVERVRMQALVNEMQLARSGIVDPATGARIGRLLEAQVISAGTLALRAEDVSVASQLSDTFTRSMITDFTRESAKTAFFELEKEIVFDILLGLGIAKEDLDDAVLAELERMQTRNYDAFILYGMGLSFLDGNQLTDAKQSFEQAVRADPNFVLAEDAELDTPVEFIDAGSFALDDTRVTSETGTTDPAASGSSTARTSATSTTDTLVTDSRFTSTDTTTDVAQVKTAAISESSLGRGGPSQRFGYFTNILRNAAGDYHGIYANGVGMDLDVLSADALFGGVFNPDALTGEFDQITSLVVVDNVDPITIGLPNALTYNTLAASSSYLAWGSWNDSDEMVRQSNPASPNGHYVFDTTGYVVYGDVTSPDQMIDLVQDQTSFTYTGDARGTHAAEPDVVMTGAFTAQVDVLGGFAEIPAFDLSVSSANHSAELSGGAGQFFDGSNFGLFGGQWTVDGNPLDINDHSQTTGNLYGPRGEALGGIFFIEKDGGANSVVGAFEGSLQ